MSANEAEDAIVIGTSSDEDESCRKRRRLSALRKQTLQSPDNSVNDTQNGGKHSRKQNQPQSPVSKPFPDPYKTDAEDSISKSTGGKKSRHFAAQNANANATATNEKPEVGVQNDKTKSPPGKGKQTGKAGTPRKAATPNKQGVLQTISNFFSRAPADPPAEADQQQENPDSFSLQNKIADSPQASHRQETTAHEPIKSPVHHAKPQQHMNRDNRSKDKKSPSRKQSPKSTEKTDAARPLNGRLAGLSQLDSKFARFGSEHRGTERLRSGILVTRQASEMPQAEHALQDTVPDTDDSAGSGSERAACPRSPDHRNGNAAAPANAAVHDISSPSPQNFMTPSGRLLSSISEAEVKRLGALADEELLEELPGIGHMEEFSCMTPQERLERIREALLKQPIENSNFRGSLEKQMQKNRDRKQQAAAQGSPIQLSPLGNGQANKRFGLVDGNQQSDGEDDERSSNVRISLWQPPASNLFLIEEVLYNDPWKLLVACMLLNKTSARAVRKIIWELFKLCPTPEAGASADVEKVEAIIKPLGLFRKRAVMFKRFSQEYLEKDWTDPQQLHGIGRYAADAYYMFCRNKWRQRDPPTDKDLRMYYNFLVDTDGDGRGFEREELAATPTSSVTSV